MKRQPKAASIPFACFDIDFHVNTTLFCHQEVQKRISVITKKRPGPLTHTNSRFEFPMNPTVTVRPLYIIVLYVLPLQSKESYGPTAQAAISY